MNTRKSSRLIFWIAALLLLVLLGSLAYIFLLGRGNLPALPVPDYWPTNGWQTKTPEQQGLNSAKLARRDPGYP